MNPIQLQLQSEAALPQGQLKEADKTAKTDARSFEDELNRATEATSQRNDTPEPESGRNVSEKSGEEERVKVAKNESEKEEMTDDSEREVRVIDDISDKIQQIQIAAENQRAETPSELPEAYEDFVVELNDSSDSKAALLVSSEIQKEIENSDSDFDFDASKIDMDEIISKAKVIGEKSEKSAEIADGEIKNIQNLAKSELGLDEKALSEVELRAGQLGQIDEELSQRMDDISPSFDAAENVVASAKNQELSESEQKTQKGTKLAVHDLRTKKPSESSLGGERIVQKVEGAKAEAKLPAHSENDNSVQMTLELASKNTAEQNITSSSSQAAGSNGSTFQAMLSNAVQANAPEIVKAGNIILKDKNSGSINLILKPENLGSVKISLNLSDKLVSGQITVSSKEAMDAFRESIDSIRQAFTESGFETGSFDLNFSQGNEFAQNPNGSGDGNFTGQIYGERKYSEFITEADGSIENDSYGVFSDGSVNIVA